MAETRQHLQVVALVALAALAATPAAAQYRAAGSDLELIPNRKQQLEKAVEQARWSLGAIRISPWLGVRDVTYVRELDPQTGERQRGDLTATAGAGLKAYLPLGEHVIAAAHALPEYTWWQRQKERNAAVGHYGLGIFSWFNRLEGEITARRVEAVEFASPDLLVREPIRSDEAAASTQVRLFGSLALFAGGSASRVRVDATPSLTPVDPSLLLDRDATRVRGGLRYLLRGDRGYIGAGVLRERTQFQGLDAVRSNKGSSWYAESALRGNHLDLTAQYDQRDLEADDSSFPGYRAGNGHAALTLHPGWRLLYQLYGRRELLYSALDAGRYLEEQRAGAGVRFALGSGGLQLFYEVGDNRFFGNTLGAPNESVTARGAWLDFHLLRHIAARIGGRITRFEPDGGGQPREIREINGSLALTLGQPGEW
ncbi:MAG TPA: hypothetical protein VGV61_11555 [Thermoanaerobaculia bacterium]|jgi:hypothetical protein|nr:hypothetical protein [Thermoanaerobaculia bacterium]